MSAAGTEQPKLAAIIPQRRIDVAAHHPLAQRKETPALDPLDEHRRLRRSLLSRFHSTGHRPCLWLLGLAFWIGIDPLLGAEKRPAASFEALTEFARTASLRAAAKAGDVTRVEVLLKEHPTWARSTDLDGNTLLHTAASTGNPTLAQLLLTYGIPINATNQTGHTALHIAAQQGHTNVVGLLLSQGAALHLDCVHGKTPLHEAAETGSAAVLDLLVTHGAWFDAKDRTEGNTPLHLAAAHGHKQAVELLLARGADAAATNGAGELALELASQANHEGVARLLRLHLAEVAARTADDRMPVLVLPFDDGTRDPEQAYGRYTVAHLLTGSLGKLKTIRVLPDSAWRFGFRALNLKSRDQLTADHVRQMGELVEARRVVWGSYRRIDGRWQVSARVLRVATGKRSRRYQASSTDWFTLRDNLVDRIVRELELRPSPEETRQMRARFTESAEALTWAGKALTAWEERQSFDQMEGHLRRALAADPQCHDLRRFLAASLGSQGKLDEAETAVLTVLQSKPDNAAAHRLLGIIHQLRNKRTAAFKELRLALRLDAEDTETWERMGELHAWSKHREAALHFWSTAARLDPTDASFHASLARGYAATHDRDLALHELKEVARLDPEDLGASQFVPEVYETLGEIPLAVEHYENFCRLARQRGLNVSLVERYEKRLLELRARLAVTSAVAPMPREYSAAELGQLLAARLTPEQLSLVENPLASTAAMHQWAQDLTRQAPDDQAKARALFDALSHRIQLEQGAHSWTAQEVFAAWERAGEYFTCNEQAKLYVALARAVGLKAFYVHLEKDVSGKLLYHDCAIVFFRGQALLVDSAYHWFGVPHQGFVVLNDLQTIAHHWLQGRDDPQQLARARAGVKLHPDSAWAHLQLARTCADASLLDEMERALADAQKLEADRWDWHIVKGMLEAGRQHLDEAAQHLREGLKRNPHDGVGHLVLGHVLRDQGQYAAARDEYRAALDCQLRPRNAQAARRALALVNARLTGD